MQVSHYNVYCTDILFVTMQRLSGLLVNRFLSQLLSVLQPTICCLPISMCFGHFIIRCLVAGNKCRKWNTVGFFSIAVVFNQLSGMKSQYPVFGKNTGIIAHMCCVCCICPVMCQT